MKYIATVMTIAITFGFGFLQPGSIHAFSGKVISNPADPLVLVDKNRMLPVDYFPKALVTPDVPISSDAETLHPAAAGALEKMFAAAAKEGVDLFAVRGYRSYSYQESYYQTALDEYGETYATNTTPKPGHSEHQTGLAIDVSTPEVNNQLTGEFANTMAGKWLQNHAHEYGYLIRYPEGKKQITGYYYKPWHLRYIGTKAATTITHRHLTLDEYAAEKRPSSMHTVKAGDTLWSISQQYEDVSVQKLLLFNPDIDPFNLQIGAKIKIGSKGPESGESTSKAYAIKAGDTLWSIASRYDDVTLQELLHANPGIKPTALQINQVIHIPTD